MAKTIASVIGVVFILVGIVGFFSPHLMETHLTPAHNIVHLVSGAASLYIGTKGSLSGARSFCIIFGLVYGLLGVCGYFLGAPPNHLLTISDPHLMFGTMDHYIHIAIGVLYLVGGFATKTSASA